jgi:hypothetical protein
VSEDRKDIRVRVNDETHRWFHALAQADGETGEARLRRLIAQDVEREMARHKALANILAAPQTRLVP